MKLPYAVPPHDFQITLAETEDMYTHKSGKVLEQNSK